MASQEFWRERQFGASEILSGWILVMVLMLGAAFIGLSQQQDHAARTSHHLKIGMSDPADCAASVSARADCLARRTIAARAASR